MVVSSIVVSWLVGTEHYQRSPQANLSLGFGFVEFENAKAEVNPLRSLGLLT